MSNLQSAIRQKRFKVANGMRVGLLIELESGHKIKGDLVDASMNGGAVYFTGEGFEENNTLLNIGDLVPDARLSWGEHACTLGRLVIKRVGPEVSGGVVVGFKLIDGRIPLLGSLGRYFEGLATGEDNPMGFEIGSQKYSVANFHEGEFSHPDLFEKCRQYKFLLDDLKKNPLFQYYSVKSKSEGARTSYKLPGSNRKVDCVSFASYDYLGFSQHPEVKEAAIKAIEKFGVSAGGSAILAGKTELHEELEYRIAKLLGKGDAILFTTGFATNVGVISSLCRSGDLICADICSHASLYDGMFSSKAKSKFFRHNDTAHLEQLLIENREAHYGTLIVTEGLFSMEGSIPDVRQTIDVAHRHQARVLVDECHALGVYGPNRLGVCDQDGMLDKVDIFMGSFSKGLGGGIGGFVAAAPEVIEWLRFFARVGMFSAAIPPAIVGAGLKILDLIASDKSAHSRLMRNIERFRAGLKRIGLSTTADINSPIVPVIVSDEKTMGNMNRTLLEFGVYVNCILYPAVPATASRFRFSITALHTDSDIDLAILALEKAAIASDFFKVPLRGGKGGQ